jgi:DUF971 family protein
VKTAVKAPTGIRLRQAAHRLELTYDDGSIITLSAELLRVLAPASPGDSLTTIIPGPPAPLIGGKRLVSLLAAEPVGNYALRLRFSDGFDSGIYSWDFLGELGREQSVRWRRYLRLLEDAGLSRD